MNNPRIFRFQPFATDKSQFGKVYNEHCAIVPRDDDWIQIMDWDAMILAKEAYPVIDAAIKRFPDTAIFGAKTNRVNRLEQRCSVELDTNDSMLYHLHKAKAHAESYKDGQCDPTSLVAGFFLLFRKSYWKHNHFQEHILNRKAQLFDYNFCLKARRDHLPIRIIRGLYVWHTYRMTHENTYSVDHLK